MENPANWKEMDPEKIEMMFPWNLSLHFDNPNINTIQVAEEVEGFLKNEVSNFRKS